MSVNGATLALVAEQRSSPPRPLDALRRATFAHAAHIDLLRMADTEAGPAPDAPRPVTAVPPSAALKPKRKARQR